MDNQRQQLIKRIAEANYILVTVNSNPTFDQLAAAIGLTLMFNKLNKYATAIFSGKIPASLNFLNPEKTFEKTTDSLRDFIISLDKDKADKLRYKIEDNFVKIFISPYHSAITEKDLVYSMGDFNVDVVVALGIVKREELDSVITEHGRILHDATIATINTSTTSSLGAINWNNPKASSLCEMLVDFCTDLKSQDLLDGQIANALLSGIIDETAQFSNTKTTSDTMAAGSKLLHAGANQQLVSQEVLSGASTKQHTDEKFPKVEEKEAEKPPAEHGSLQVDHQVAVDLGKKDELVPGVAKPAQSTTPTGLHSEPEVKHDIETPSDKLEAKETIVSSESSGNITSDAPLLDADDSGISGKNQEIDAGVEASSAIQTPLMNHGAETTPVSTASGAITTDGQPLDTQPQGPLKPVEALNAQPIDLDKNKTIEVPEVKHKNPNGFDQGIGSNIEFSDPPPPVPPPIIPKE
jgi:hypothetical protein